MLNVEKILILTNSLTGGGAERSANLISDYLYSSNMNVGIVPINKSQEDFISPNCPIYSLGRDWKSGVISTLFALIKWHVVLWKFKPTTLVLNCDLPELFGAFSLKRVRLVAVEHTNHSWKNRELLGKIIRKTLSFRKAEWVAVSEHLLIWPDNKSPDEIIENPLTRFNSQEISTAPCELMRLVFVGRLSDEKNPSLAISVAERTNFPLHIFGDGILNESLTQKSRNLSTPVTFHGQVKNPWQFIEPGDLLIVPSRYEGDGLVILEALSMNVPMLISKISDLQRFGLPEKNYCDGLEDFCSRILEYKTCLSELQVSNSIAYHITSKRKIENIGQHWIKFLAKHNA